ncbi:hypothetical protein JG687_00010010 [Phytophthora cactorum]|uniref:Uncharacterized protein n=1 Tax=Phytophthora cactorum TaxID=29920 RepID=A0A8T1U8F4_9STRA|nr:hypothetical protein JG687_00010010 [Phytophthora cactorum]
MDALAGGAAHTDGMGRVVVRRGVGRRRSQEGVARVVRPLLDHAAIAMDVHTGGVDYVAANDPSRVTVSAPGCAAAIATTERVAACSVQALRAVEEGQGASEHSNQRCKQFCAQEEGFRAASVVAAHTRREKGKASTGAPCNESRESAFGNKSVECMFKVDASLPGSRPDSPSESPTDIRSDMPKDSLSGMTHLPEYTTVPAEMGERRTSSEPPGMNLQPCGFHAPVQVAITQAAVVGYGSVSGQSSVFMVRATTAVAQKGSGDNQSWH